MVVRKSPHYVRTIPIDWLARAAEYRSYAVMVVSLELWFRVGVKRCKVVRLDYRGLRIGLGLTPSTVRQALWALHESGLITVRPRGPGRKMEVTVHTEGLTPTGLRRSLPRRAPWPTAPTNQRAEARD